MRLLLASSVAALAFAGAVFAQGPSASRPGGTATDETAVRAFMEHFRLCPR